MLYKFNENQVYLGVRCNSATDLDVRVRLHVAPLREPEALRGERSGKLHTSSARSLLYEQLRQRE